MPFVWERIESELPARDTQRPYPTAVFRAKVPGGWFVLIEGQDAFFYPDPDHAWSGETMK